MTTTAIVRRFLVASMALIAAGAFASSWFEQTRDGRVADWSVLAVEEAFVVFAIAAPMAATAFVFRRRPHVVLGGVAAVSAYSLVMYLAAASLTDRDAQGGLIYVFIPITAPIAIGAGVIGGLIFNRLQTSRAKGDIDDVPPTS